jgi:hypothetical protein
MRAIYHDLKILAILQGAEWKAAGWKLKCGLGTAPNAATMAEPVMTDEKPDSLDREINGAR